MKRITGRPRPLGHLTNFCTNFYEFFKILVNSLKFANFFAQVTNSRSMQTSQVRLNDRLKVPSLSDRLSDLQQKMPDGRTWCNGVEARWADSVPWGNIESVTDSWSTLKRGQKPIYLVRCVSSAAAEAEDGTESVRDDEDDTRLKRMTL